MRISQLAALSGVPLPTVKFYLREGLLQPGDARAVNQADYTDAHLRRLRLIKALIEIGGMRIRELRAVLAAIDDEQVPLHDLLGIAQVGLAPADEAGAATSSVLVDGVLDELGWQVSSSAPARGALVRAIATLRDLGWDVGAGDLVRYGRAVDRLAEREVASVPRTGSRSQIVEHMVIGTVLFEAVIAALRRLAQEHYSALAFGGPAGRPSASGLVDPDVVDSKLGRKDRRGRHRTAEVAPDREVE